MKSIFIAALALAAVVGTASTSYAQSSHRQILSPTKNYQDPETGKTYILTRVTPDISTATITGTVKVTINFTIKSTWPTGAKPAYFCEADLDVSSINESALIFTEYLDQASVPATVTGTAGTCAVTIPYSWVLPTATTTNGISNTLAGSYGIYVINTAATVSEPSYELRYVTGPFLNTETLPASGTTTTETVTTVI